MRVEDEGRKNRPEPGIFWKGRQAMTRTTHFPLSLTALVLLALGSAGTRDGVADAPGVQNPRYLLKLEQPSTFWQNNPVDEP
jgi:hypothetical protein